MTICDNNMNIASPVPYALTPDDIVHLYGALTCGHCMMLMARRCGMESETRAVALEIANRVVLALPCLVGDGLVKPDELTSIVDYKSASRTKTALWEASLAASQVLHDSAKWETLFDATEMVGCVMSEYWPTVAWHASKVDPSENQVILAAIRERWSVQTLVSSLERLTTP